MARPELHQATSDLVWAVTSPSLVGGDNVAPPGRLDRTDIDSEALDAFLAARPVHRVGRYFENLVHYWLRDVRGVEVVGAGVQLRDGKHTVGELDFLYRGSVNADGKGPGPLVHCEAAIKFFLHSPRSDASDYPGPNASDDFENKATKLFDKQLPISAVHVPGVAQREAFVKGMIFYHVDDEQPVERPDRLAQDHLRGRWLRACELDWLVQRHGVVATIASKPFWLAPQHDASLREPQQLAGELRVHFETGPAHPFMLSLRDSSTSAEVERLFVVSNEWPL